MDIERYIAEIDTDGEIIFESHKDGNYVYWEDVEPLFKELEELQGFYETIMQEADWMRWRLKK